MNLYIGNLSEIIEDKHLKEAFKEFGKVKTAKVIKDKITGKSRGFGFIDMPDENEALQVIKTVNGSKWEGNILTVKKAFDKD